MRRWSALRHCAALGAVLALASTAASAEAQTAVPADSVPRPVAERGRLDAYVHDLTRPVALVAPLAVGVVDHLRDAPEAWGGGADGLARRVGSRLGQEVVRETVFHATSAVLGAPTERRPCRCRGTGRRLLHGAAEGLTPPRVAGAYAAAFAPMLWRRPELDSDDALRTGTITALASAVVGAVREVLRSEP